MDHISAHILADQASINWGDLSLAAHSALWEANLLALSLSQQMPGLLGSNTDTWACPNDEWLNFNISKINLFTCSRISVWSQLNFAYTKCPNFCLPDFQTFAFPNAEYICGLLHKLVKIPLPDL